MPALTPRERQILQLLATLDNRQIAQTLGIAELTVRKHRANLCAKLGLTSSAALIAHAMTLRGSGAAIAAPPFSRTPDTA